jgi:hypothetical protein
MDSSRRLRNALQSYFDALVKGPPPERWADLIERLNEEDTPGAEPKRHRSKNLKLGRARCSSGRKRSSSKRIDL